MIWHYIGISHTARITIYYCRVVHSHQSYKIILALLQFFFFFNSPSSLETTTLQQATKKKQNTRHIGYMIRSRQRSIVMRFLCNILLISLFNKQHERKNKTILFLLYFNHYNNVLHRIRIFSCSHN